MPLRALPLLIDSLLKRNKPLPEGVLPVLPADKLLISRRNIVKQIERLVGVSDAVFGSYYLEAIEKFAEFTQEATVSRGGKQEKSIVILDHALEAITAVLSYRQGIVLPSSATAEVVAKQKHVWTYAVFAATLLHDTAHLFNGREMHLFGRGREPIGKWRPWLGSMREAGAAHYQVQPESKEVHLSGKLPLLLAREILPPRGLSWLSDSPELFGKFIAAVSADWGKAAELGQVVRKGHGYSTAWNMEETPANNKRSSAKKGRQASATAADNETQASNPLGGEFYEWLKSGLRNGAIKMNETGAPVHIVEEGIFLTNPLVFQMFAGKSGHKNWQKIQTAFRELEINAMAGNGADSLFRYLESDKENSRELKGWILPDIHAVFGDSHPRPHPGLVLSK